MLRIMQVCRDLFSLAVHETEKVEALFLFSFFQKKLTWTAGMIPLQVRQLDR